MKVSQEKCIECELCIPYCPVGAIGSIEQDDEPVFQIDQEECVECGVCLKADVCAPEALYMPELEWPRSVRAAFSNPLIKHPATKLEGRGTEEMKTNDVTGRFARGIVGLAVEMGRPGVGTTFRDIQKVSTALATAGVEFEPENPVTSLIVDRDTGKIDELVLDEKVLSAIVEFKIETGRLKEILNTLKGVSSEIDTVFSLCLINRVESDGSTPGVRIAEEAGFAPLPNTKTNVGLGRPLAVEI
jgi:Pyruvate/2-oxoacid:ferredoxin oxidoreductase delta subunit